MQSIHIDLGEIFMQAPSADHLSSDTACHKVLAISAHPRSPSLCRALAGAYTEGARAAGMEVELLDLSQMNFNPDVLTDSPLQQHLEPDLERAKALIDWADHLCFVYPAWWGMGPARLKGFLDRVLLPGFAFRETDNQSYEGLLTGKTAHLITTMDMPGWVYRWIYRRPGHVAMKLSTLGFCGISTDRIVSLGPVKHSDADQRKAWLEQVRQLGFSLQRGTTTAAAKARRKFLAWLKALRLQFYPMTLMAYSVGALGACQLSDQWDWTLYWLGYACLFFGEAATVFTNEWFDFDSDRRNRDYSPFNGGSRVLVNGELSYSELRIGIVTSLLAAAVCAGFILERMDNQLAISGALLVMLVLGLGYTAPPLKLAWRGLGEINVGVTHSIGVVMIGYLLQGGQWSDAFPWLVSLPLFLAVLPAIILSGLPDLEADREAGKLTLAVRLGRGRVTLLALVLALIVPVVVMLINDLPVLLNSFDGILPWIMPHAILIAFLLAREWRSQLSGRKDGLMIASLSYIIWFGLIPLLQLS